MGGTYLSKGLGGGGERERERNLLPEPPDILVLDFLFGGGGGGGGGEKGEEGGEEMGEGLGGDEAGLGDDFVDPAGGDVAYRLGGKRWVGGWVGLSGKVG